MSRFNSNSKTSSSNLPVASPPYSVRLRWALLTGLVAVVIVGVGLWNWYEDRAITEFQKADKAIQEGDLAAGYSHLQLAAAADPGSANVSGRLADLAIRLGLLDEGEFWISQIGLEGAELKPRLRFAVAQRAMELADAGRVERLLKAILLEDPQQLGPRQMLARLYLLTLRPNELRQQIAAMDNVVDKRIETDFLMLYCIGDRTRWGQKEPRIWMEQALRIDPANAAVRSGLAKLLFQSQENEKARQILAENPSGSTARDQWRVVLMQIEDLLNMGSNKQAAALLGSLDSAARNEAHYWISRGRVALNDDDLSAARSSFEMAMQLDQLLAEPAYRLGRLSLRQGDERAASKLFERSELLDKLVLAAKRVLEDPVRRNDSLLEMAKITEQLGLKRLALLIYTAVAGENPELATIRAKIADLRSEPAAMRSLADMLVVGGTASVAEPVAVTSNHPRSIPEVGIHQKPEANLRYPQFQDIAESVGLTFGYHCAPTLPDKPLMMNVTGGGIGVLDYDRDGWPDLFFSQGTAIPVPKQSDENIGRLFRNVRGQRFEEVTSAATLLDFGFGQGCSVADYDNDGFADLLVCHYGALRLYRNNGDGTFQDATAASGIADQQWSSSAAFGDFDRDGDLDFFVVHYISTPLPAEKCCLPIYFPRTQNAIWENRGDGTFIERSEQAGILKANATINGGTPALAYGLSAVVEDLDNDGWLDIYVANDMTPNFLFRNLGQAGLKNASPFTFAEIGVKAGAAVNGKGEVEASMGLACADVDDNGWFDLFVTNFQEETNTFYRNEGVDGKNANLIFTDDTARAGLLDLNPPKMGWGCQFVDALGSGRLDLFLLNGHLQSYVPQTPSFFSNRGGRFTELKLTSTYFQTERSGRALATLDWNRDLRPDLVATYLRGNVSLINNDSAIGHRVEIELVGRTCNRDAESARVAILRGTRRAVYRVSRGGGFLVSNEKNLVVGFGDVQEAHWEILWPSGLRQDCGTCRAGRHYLVIEGEPPQELPPS